jgi:Tfp pilus assembly protein PilN
MALDLSFRPEFRKLLAFGSGVGLEIGPADLEVVVARVRPTGVRVLGRLRIERYAERPAAEWGAEYSRFVKESGAGYLSATVLLPRRDVIVRNLSLPGVAAKDLEGAIRFQLESLHPYGDEEVVWGWSQLPYGAVLVGVVRRSTIDRYLQLFAEAGIPVWNFTFSAAAVHAAIRLNGHDAGDGFVALSVGGTGAVEVYGESITRPVFSAQLDMPAERAAVLALSELRLPPDTAPLTLEQVLPKPSVNPVENDLSRNALPYATALAGACPHLAPAANVLPAEYRRSRSRAIFVPSAILATLALLVSGSIWGYQKYADHQYLKLLQAQIAQLEVQEHMVRRLDRDIDDARARTELLDRYRSQPRADLEALDTLTKLVDPPTWTNTLDLTPAELHINGTAPQAAPLLKIIDSTPLFRNSQMDMVQRAPSGNGEVFQIHANRGGRP